MENITNTSVDNEQEMEIVALHKNIETEETLPGLTSENLEKDITDLPVCNKQGGDTQVIAGNEALGKNISSVDKSNQQETCSSLESATQSYDPKDVHYEGDTAIYTDSSTGYQYQWDTEKNEWVSKSNVTYGFEDDTHVYTDADGSKFFWDKEKNAWIPKIDDDFMARYQMNYGFVDNTNIKPPTDNSSQDKIDKVVENEQNKKVKGEKRKASDPAWFELDESQNTNVYVSNLPLDIEESEFVDLMQKYGLVMRDPTSGNFKVKLYKEPGTDMLKGDALCTYIKRESVDLALKLLDGYEYRDHKINVDVAKFQLKGEFDPKLKPKMKKKKDKLKLKKQQEKLFDWRPEKKIGDRAKHERIVIVKNLFEPTIFDQDVGLILEFQQDLREECSKIGEVHKVTIYDRHPEGVAQINMSSAEEADEVVLMLNNRWFMKRQLTAEIWDGKTKFKIAETDSQISERLDGWDKFLEGDEHKPKEIGGITVEKSKGEEKPVEKSKEESSDSNEKQEVLDT